MTYASTIQSNQAKIVAMAPEGKLVKKDDLLVLFDAAPFEEEIRRNQALLAQAQADLVKAQQDLNLQRSRTARSWPRPGSRWSGATSSSRTSRRARAGSRRRRPRPRWATPSASCKKAESALADLKPLLAEGFITEGRAGARRAAGEPGPGGPATSPDAAATRCLNFGRPLELAQARSDAVQSKETRAPARGRRVLPAWRRSGPPSTRRRAASTRPRASSTWPRPSSRGPRCAPTCPGSWSTRRSSSARSRGSRRWATRSGPTSP